MFHRPCWIALSCPTPQGHEATVATGDDGLWTGLWALQFTPHVARQEEAWVLDVTSTLRMWGGLPRLLQRLRGQWPLPSVPLALAVGPSALGALARVRIHPSLRACDDAHGLCQPDLLDPAALLHLPLASLSALQAHVAVLDRLGVQTWVQFDRLPRAGVVRRWGTEGLLALDRALGRCPHPLPWLQAPPVFSHTLELPHALESAAGLMVPVRQLLAALHGWLAQRHSGVLAVRWRWVHDTRRDVPVHGELVLRLAQPVQQPDHLQRLTAEHLAQVRWPAPVVRLGLDTLDLAPWVPTTLDALKHPVRPGNALSTGGDTAARSGATDKPAPFTQSWTELLEHLRARLGASAVVQWQVQDTHLSEASQRPGMPLSVAWPRSLAEAPNGSPDVSPTWLADPPVPLRLRGDRPVYQGALELLAGPHRIEWVQWPGAPASLQCPPPTVTVRDHFLARSPGAGLVWVYRQRGADPGTADVPAWFLQGWMA